MDRTWNPLSSVKHPKRDTYGRGSVCDWGGISLGKRTELHIFPKGTVNSQVYRDDILDAFMHPYVGIIDDAFTLAGRQCKTTQVSHRR